MVSWLMALLVLALLSLTPVDANTYSTESFSSEWTYGSVSALQKQEEKE